MAENIVIVGTYPPTKCGLATFDANLATYAGQITAEIGSKMVAPIDEDGLSFYAPANPNLVIEKWNSESWLRTTCEIAKIACEKDSPSTNILSHEFGLDPDPDLGPDDGRCKGNNFVNTASILGNVSKKMKKSKRMLTIPILHTVPPEPDEHQKKIIQMLGKECDAVMVMTKVARNFLTSDVYGIDPNKVDYINHGVRVHDISRANQEKNLSLYGFKDSFNVTVTGHMSPSKGLIEIVQGFAAAKKSLPSSLSKKLKLILAGGFHVGFLSAEGGKHYREYIAQFNQAIEETKLKYLRTDKVEEFIDVNKGNLDIIHLDRYLPEDRLKEIYAISRAFIANHTDMGQMHSGTVPEAMGASIPQIATKFYNALEMLADISTQESVPYKGQIIGLDIYRGQTAGFLIDPGIDSIAQISKSLDYMVRNPKDVESMSRKARSKARMMTWNNTALELVQYIFDLRARL